MPITIRLFNAMPSFITFFYLSLSLSLCVSPPHCHLLSSKKMVSASHSPICLILMFTSFSTFMISESHLLRVAWDSDNAREMVEKVSGEDNVAGEIITRIRILLRLNNSLEIKLHNLSPAPAPVESALTHVPILPLIRKRGPPEHHKTHILSPLHHSKNHHGMIIAVVLSIGVTVILLAAIIAAALVCKRSRRARKKKRSCQRSKSQTPLKPRNKVSFDPGPDLFFLNSSESKYVLSVTSEAVTSSPSQDAELADEAIHPIDQDLSSDDESYHSICNSHSSTPNSSPLSTVPMQMQSPLLIINVDIPTIPSPPPPPPPPPPMLTHRNIPKPPPLPPLPPKPPSSQIGCSSSRPPLPPPCPPRQNTPIGKDGTPLPKLKPLHWDKVRAAPNRAMVWDKIRSSSFELDEKMIESLFGYNVQNSTKNEEAKAKSSSPSKHVLDHKRLQNVTILLKALNTTAEQVCTALMKGGGLSVQQLEALVKMVLTKEEEEKLSGYEGDITELDPAEQFIKAVLNIPFASSRIEAMLYKETFEDEVVHLKKSFEMLEDACKELRSSRLFFKLLEAVLKTGNRMNVGTIRGDARAFKLDALLKLSDVKGTDGKTTLLHFVVQEMVRSESVAAMEKTHKKDVVEKEEDSRLMGLDFVSGLSTELSNVKKTASIDLDVLVTSVSNLSSGLGQLRELVEGELKGSFVLSMKTFLSHAKRRIEELKQDEDKVLLHVREITEYYHGNVSKDEANPLRIFVVVRDFLSMLDRVCKEIRSLKNHLGPSHVLPFR